MTREEMFQIGCELVRDYSPIVETKVEITIVEPAKIKENVFSPRQLQFSRDAQKQLIEKYKNPKYEAHQVRILEEIIKKYQHSKKQKNVIDEKVKIYESFLSSINPQQPTKDVLFIDLAA